MPHVGIKGMLTEARQNQYGVLSLLAGNMDMILGMIAAAESQNAPLILTFNQDVSPQVPMELAFPMIVNAAERASVPVATTLDHGDSLETAVKAIHLGVSSVMFDGSKLSYDENVKQTREIVRVAHALSVDVEAELGSIAGSSVDTASSTASLTPDSNSNGSFFTDPDMAVDFIAQTGVDALAISFGNVHGTYAGEPVLDFDLVRTIFRQVKIPLVMHGASGLADEEYQKIVECGISKVCYYSAMGKRAANDIRGMLEETGHDGARYHEIVSQAIEFFRADTINLMKLVGCIGVV
jgi:fructose-bisphosphate aldolase, class II